MLKACADSQEINGLDWSLVKSNLELNEVIDIISKHLWWIIGAVFILLLSQVVLFSMGISNQFINTLSMIGLDYVVPVLILVIAFKKFSKKG
jgi:hypothetical protein